MLSCEGIRIRSCKISANPSVDIKMSEVRILISLMQVGCQVPRFVGACVRHDMMRYANALKTDKCPLASWDTT